MDDAEQIVEQNISYMSVKVGISYKNDYVFCLQDPSNPKSPMYDPFVSVDKNTGEFSDFSIFTDADPSEIIPLFQDALEKQ